MNKKNILILSSDDWGWKTSKYHVSKRLSQENRVVFISSIGFRSPKVSAEHAKRIIGRLRSFAAGAQKQPEGPYTFSPLAIPFVGFPMRDRLNRFVLRLQMKWIFRKLDFRPDYVITFSQNWYPFLRLFDARHVYYCVDNQSAFASVDGERFAELDRLVSAKADAVFCSSKILYETKSGSHSNVHYSPHGVEYKLFRQAVTEQFPLPNDLTGIPGPRLLFFGHLSGDWVDAQLLKEIAKKRSDWSIVLIGRYSFDEGEFSGIENIHVLGEKEFAMLPAYCAHSDIGLIPFVDSELVRNCNPLKLPEYLSAGLPVVSTPIPEVIHHKGDAVRIARGTDAWISECSQLLDSFDKKKSATLSDSLSDASWESRVAVIAKILDEL